MANKNEQTQPVLDPDDIAINPSDNRPLNAFDLSRRQLLKGGLSAAAMRFLGLGITSQSAFATAQASLNQNPLNQSPNNKVPFIGFTGVPVQQDPNFDQVKVADGYRAEAFFSWGDPVVTGAEEWKNDASNTWQAQLTQAGDNHDGMHFFAFPDDDSRGLLVVNHEYVNQKHLHTNGGSEVADKRPIDEVKKEQAAHGVSVIELKKDRDHHWHRVYPSSYNRRISTLTPMKLSGPLAGHDLMKTVDDPSGLAVLGTLNNCSNGFTPWGTYLACEENWHLYFINRDAKDYQSRVAHHRYGVLTQPSEYGYHWYSSEPRFDATPNQQSAHGGFVNEPNRFGWVVEIDPFNPESTPIKRTAFGRFCRECVAPAIAENGQMAFYSGDDTNGEYIYKFVPVQRFDKNTTQHNNDYLDNGILYVAQLDDDGTGRWLPLVHGHYRLNAKYGFNSQADVLVNARAAADLLGATPMDRPEWATTNPHNLDVYISLTNNTERGTGYALNAANPRAENLHGQIIKICEKEADPAATTFTWDLFLLAGEREGAADKNGKPVADNLIGNINGDIFSSPDGLGFDQDGRLWIMTDYYDDIDTMHNMGSNQVLCADPKTREVKRFLVGPHGCELTGITWSPDYKTMWVNIQHPKLHYPASDGVTRPRSTTVMITKDDGGVIGT